MEEKKSAGKAQAKRPNYKEIISRLEAEKESLSARNAELEAQVEAAAKTVEEYLRINADIEAEVDLRTKKRLMEKDRYIARTEQELEAKIANKDLIIMGLNYNLGKAEEKILKLRRSRGLLGWLFGKKAGE